MSEKPPLAVVLHESRERGKRMGDTISMVLNELNFPIHLINEYGVICTDVGDGPEIVAFQQFHPSILYATEPIVTPNDYTSDEPTKAEVLALLAQESEVHAHVIRGSAEDAFNAIANKGKKVAMVTKLNMLPGSLHLDTLQGAAKVLIPNGLMLISLQNEHDMDMLTFYAQRKLQSYKTQVVANNGGAFLSVYYSS